MLSGLNTTGHEIGGSLGVADPRDDRDRRPRRCDRPRRRGPARPRHRRRVPRRGDHRRRRERRRVRHPALRRGASCPSWRSLPASRSTNQPHDAARTPDPAHRAAPPPRGRRAQRRTHPRRRRRRTGRRSRSQHGRDRPPGRRGTGHHLCPLPDPRVAHRRGHASGRSPKPRRRSRPPSRSAATPPKPSRRVIASAWRVLGRYHALVVMNTRLPHAELHARHRPVLRTAAAADRARPTRRWIPLRRPRDLAHCDGDGAHPRCQCRGTSPAPARRPGRVSAGRDGHRRGWRQLELMFARTISYRRRARPR